MPSGRRHSKERDARAVRHHYDVSNDFFALFLDESMTYSCAVWDRGATTLEEAQHAKRELVCTKLAIQPRERVLDIGCGWGSFAIHAARHHGARVTGITLSEPQARLAQARAKEAGVADRVDIKVMDYRDAPTSERYDAVASIGMVEHVGEEMIDVYAEQIARLLKPGGRLLNHGIARMRHSDGPRRGRSRTATSSPTPTRSRSAAPRSRSSAPASRCATWRASATTTRARSPSGSTGSTRTCPRRRRLAGDERLRVWRLYLRAARNGFETSYTSVYQTLCRLPG